MMGRQTGDQSQLFYLFNVERRIPAGQRQITLQVRASCPGCLNSNVEGIAKVASTSREAPDSVKLRTVHGSAAFFPRIIVPDLRTRRRRVFCRSAIGQK